jgi:hypothetical protein
MSATNLLKIVEEDEEARRKISVDGWNWLLSALDPFHDIQHALAGYPDLSGASSVVLEIVRTYTVDSTTLGGSNQCTVFMCPWSMISSTNTVNGFEAGYMALPVTNLASTGSGPGSSGWGLGPNAATGMLVISSSPFTPDEGKTTGGVCIDVRPNPDITVPTGGFNLNRRTRLNHDITSPHRVIGGGFEVTNTTAPLYKSGNVVVFDSPSNWSTGTTLTTTLQYNGAVAESSFDLTGPLSFRSVLGPPSTIAQAMQMHGAKQFAAADGAYCTMKFSTVANDPTSNFSYTSTSSPSGTSLLNTNKEDSLIVCQQGLTTHAANANFQAGTDQALGISQGGNIFAYTALNGCGAWFTGLDPVNTSLQVTAKWFIEVFPTPFFDPTLLPIATPSAGFDPVALEVYSRIVSKLPGGVPVGQNQLGMIGSLVGGLANSLLSGSGKGSGSSGGSALSGIPIIGNIASGIANLFGPSEGSKGADKQRAELPNEDAAQIQSGWVQALQGKGGDNRTGWSAMIRDPSNLDYQWAMRVKALSQAAMSRGEPNNVNGNFPDAIHDYAFWQGQSNVSPGLPTAIGPDFTSSKSSSNSSYLSTGTTGGSCSGCANGVPHAMTSQKMQQMMQLAPMYEHLRPRQVNYGYPMNQHALTRAPADQAWSHLGVYEQEHPYVPTFNPYQMARRQQQPSRMGLPVDWEATWLDDYDFPEATPAQRERRKKQRANRTKALKACRDANPAIFEAIRQANAAARAANPNAQRVAQQPAALALPPIPPGPLATALPEARRARRGRL